jgi:hypothetical protein
MTAAFSRVCMAYMLVRVGGVWVQLPCEFGPGAEHLLVKGCVASLVGVRVDLGAPAALAAVGVASAAVCVWPAGGGCPPPLSSPEKMHVSPGL